MKINSYCFYDSPLGRIMVAEDGDAITQIRFLTEFNYRDLSPGKTVLLEEAGIQLKEYFSGKRKLFDLPVAPEGTAFQSRVWEALLDIPYGRTRSYGQIAQTVGNGKAARAVGMANSKNPISIVIPCHRVIGFSGKLVGYGGGLDRKAYLLELEKKYTHDL